MRVRLKTIAFFLVASILIWVVMNGFLHGGQDFRVFHFAAKLAGEGRWSEIYTTGPDRYLYAPGFALLISPLGILPFSIAHIVWLLLTLTAFVSTLFVLARKYGEVSTILAFLFLLRPIAIDFRYGQINLLILTSAVLAMLAWFERTDTIASRKKIGMTWFIFSIAAATKIYPLALFLFPVLSLFSKEDRRNARIALTGACGGGLLLLVPPLFISGVYPAWLDALARRGIPTDPHNQSLPAFLMRIFGGEPFYPLGMNGVPLQVLPASLTQNGVHQVWILFALFNLELLSRVIWERGRGIRREGIAAWIGLALCVLPAHLIWKSYFVLGLPLLVAIFSEFQRDKKILKLFFFPVLLLGLFMNFTSMDFIGPRASSWIEACSPFLWAQYFFIFIGFLMLSNPAKEGRTNRA